MILHAEALIKQRGKKIVFIFDEDVIFNYIDNPERELELRNVRMLTQ